LFLQKNTEPAPVFKLLGARPPVGTVTRLQTCVIERKEPSLKPAYRPGYASTNADVRVPVQEAKCPEWLAAEWRHYCWV